MSPDWSVKAEPVPYAKMDNPQTLNLYAYVGNNPLTRRDLDGHDLWMKGCGKKTATCDHDYVGSWDKDHKKFTATLIQSDQNGKFSGHTVGMTTSGISVDGRYQGVFASGTAATVVKGTGNLSGFQGSFSSSCMGHCTASGNLSALSGHSLSQLMPTLKGPDESLDKFSTHEGSQYRGGNVQGPDLHVSYVADRAAASAHFDWAYPFGSGSGFVQHTKDFIEIGVDKALGGGDPPYNKVGP